MSDSEDHTHLRPIAEPETIKTKVRWKKPLPFPKLSLWSQIIGAILAIASIILALRGMIGDFPLQGSNRAIAEHFSTIMLFGFLGSFGFVPGLLMFWWGRTLRNKPYKPIMAVLPALFSLPFWGLSIFIFLHRGLVYGSIAFIISAVLCLVGLYMWRREPKSAQT